MFSFEKIIAVTIFRSTVLYSGIFLRKIKVKKPRKFDAGIATKICVGILNSFCLGIGGGGFYLYRNKESEIGAQTASYPW